MGLKRSATKGVGGQVVDHQGAGTGRLGDASPGSRKVHGPHVGGQRIERGADELAGFWPTVNVKTVFKITYGSATSWSADCVKIGNQFRGNLKHRSLKVLAKVLDRRCSRDHQDVVRPLKKPSQRDLHGRGIRGARPRQTTSSTGVE